MKNSKSTTDAWDMKLHTPYGNFRLTDCPLDEDHISYAADAAATYAASFINVVWGGIAVGLRPEERRSYANLVRNEFVKLMNEYHYWSDPDDEAFEITGDRSGAVTVTSRCVGPEAPIAPALRLVN